MNKIPRDKINQQVKDIQSENYKTLKKEIEEDNKEMERYLSSWTRRVKIIKMAIPPQPTK